MGLAFLLRTQHEVTVNLVTGIPYPHQGPETARSTDRYVPHHTRYAIVGVTAILAISAGDRRIII